MGHRKTMAMLVITIGFVSLPAQVDLVASTDGVPGGPKKRYRFFGAVSNWHIPKGGPFICFFLA